MSKHLTGWGFVAIQALLLGALILLPHRNDWPTPAPIDGIGFALVLGGLAIAAIAALGLGRSLTPTPVPVSYGQLTTDGLYRLVRHPIYTGVLAIVGGLAIRSGSWVSGFVAVITIIFFNRKAAWEEARLAERYEGYPEYARATPRFVPRPRRAG